VLISAADAMLGGEGRLAQLVGEENLPLAAALTALLLALLLGAIGWWALGDMFAAEEAKGRKPGQRKYRVQQSSALPSRSASKGVVPPARGPVRIREEEASRIFGARGSRGYQMLSDDLQSEPPPQRSFDGLGTPSRRAESNLFREEAASMTPNMAHSFGSSGQDASQARQPLASHAAPPYRAELPVGDDNSCGVLFDITSIPVTSPAHQVVAHAVYELARTNYEVTQEVAKAKLDLERAKLAVITTLVAPPGTLPGGLGRPAAPQSQGADRLPAGTQMRDGQARRGSFTAMW
jgi:hypothetical protein